MSRWAFIALFTTLTLATACSGGPGVDLVAVCQRLPPLVEYSPTTLAAGFDSSLNKV